MALDSRLLLIIACPEDKGALLYFENENALYNPRLRLKYRIEGGVPQMLVDAAARVDDAEHARLVELAHHDDVALNF